MTRKRENLNKPFGETQAVAYVRLGNHPTAGMADTGTVRSVIDREVATRARAVPLGRRGTMNIAGHRVRGELMRMRVRLADSPCAAVIDALVPDQGEPFRKGVLLGMDFLQNARIIVDAETGESYCSPALMERASETEQFSGKRRRHPR